MTNETPEAVDALLEKLRRQMPLLDAEQHGRERYGAIHFSPFDYIDTKETALSRLLADLLDPSASHGQGPLFLNAFLRAIDHEEVAHWKPRVTVKCEDLGDDGRIDIVVTTPHSIIGIENKPYAAQGDRQLERYVTDIKARAGRAGTLRGDVVFLSQQEPETAKERVVQMGFVDGTGTKTTLHGILTETLDEIKADRFASFVRELLNWLDKAFGGTVMSELGSYTDYVMDSFLGDDASRKAIGAVIAAHTMVHERVLDRIENAITKRLCDDRPDMKVKSAQLSKSIALRHAPFKIRSERWPKGVAICVEAHQQNFAGIYFGLRGLKPTDSAAKEYPEDVCEDFSALRQRAADLLQKAPSSNWWPWHRQHQTWIWSSEWAGRLLVETNGSPEQHPEIQAMIDELAILARLVDEYSHGAEASGG